MEFKTVYVTPYIPPAPDPLADAKQRLACYHGQSWARAALDHMAQLEAENADLRAHNERLAAQRDALLEALRIATLAVTAGAPDAG